jgi:DNA-binding GntR family transcriptional regulator
MRGVAKQRSNAVEGNRAPQTVANHITEGIRSGILEGRYELGSRLDQQTLAEEFGASIIPVRESLRQLEAEGLVRITPRRGAFVVQPTDAEVMEVYKVRAVLEAFATKEAVPQLTEDDLEELQSIGEELVLTARSKSYEKWRNVNREWHFTLYAAARSPLLLQFIGALWDRCTLTSHVYVRDPGHRLKSTEDHSRVFDAARKGDADLAAKIITEHVQNAMTEVLRGGAVQVTKGKTTARA